ncbi:MAG: RluA family pseudouridine synthase [Clostridia bacterium]|nr:RluA family pseudouridine synthase [Clostridia bacterium]
MTILFEDDSLIVCIKPAGILSQMGQNGEESMLTLLEAHTGGTVYPVHRLDKAVGGVMVYAKAKAAAAALSKQVADRSMQKEYRALVHGVPSPPAGVMEDLLFKDSRTNKVFVVQRERRGVKPARLTYETMEQRGDRALVAVVLDTGRTHQIRVQFASRRHPLVGDARYGAHDGEARLCLWSYRLTFMHPKTGEAMTFTADVPF